MSTFTPYHHYAQKAREYPRAIFEYLLPASRAECRAALAHITVAYVYWRESEPLSKRQAEDVEFLLKNRVPVIGETIDSTWRSNAGLGRVCKPGVESGV